MRTVEQLVKACGGPEKIEAASGTRKRVGKSKPVPKVSHWAVRKWSSIGIPERHWPLVMGLTETSIDELYAANQAAREARAA